MFSLRKRWHEFAAIPPGRRFEERYRRSGKRGRARIVGILAGALLTAVGIFFLLVPGPGIVFLLPGLALLAQGSLRLARWLDRSELWLRKRFSRIAYAVAALVPLFTYEADGVAVRRLRPEEFSQGLFRDGGRTLFFLDGRAAIRPLAVSASGIEEVTRALAEHDG